MNAQDSIRYITAADSKGLQTLVGKAVASYGKARIAVQVAIVAIMIHAAKHNDYSQASQLVNGLGKTAAARDVVRFFTDFAGFGVKKDETAEEKPAGFNTWKGPEYIVEHLDEAKATMFWAYKQPQGDVFKEFSLEDMARAFLTRHENAVKAVQKGKGTLDDTLSDTTMRAVLNLVKFDKLAAKPADKQDRKAA